MLQKALTSNAAHNPTGQPPYGISTTHILEKKHINTPVWCRFFFLNASYVDIVYGSLSVSLDNNHVQ